MHVTLDRTAGVSIGGELYAGSGLDLKILALKGTDRKLFPSEDGGSKPNS
jgi:hypothetical protein